MQVLRFLLTYRTTEDTELSPQIPCKQYYNVSEWLFIVASLDSLENRPCSGYVYLTFNCTLPKKKINTPSLGCKVQDKWTTSKKTAK